MNIVLVIHPPESKDVAWWAEAPVIDGFTASADDLQSLMLFAQQALREVVDGDIELSFRLETSGTEGDGLYPVFDEGSPLSELVA